MADGSIKIDTKINTGDVAKDLARLKTNLGAVASEMNTMANKALVGMTAGVVAFTAATKKFADVTGRIADMSQALGLSTKSFQELDYALKLSGSSIDSMQMGMKALMEKAGSNDIAFKKLGVSIKEADGSMRSQEDILKDTIRAFQEMEDGTGKAALAQDLFSRSGQELMPMLNAEAGSLDELTTRANELGLVMTEETVAAGEALGDTIDELTMLGSALINTAIAPLAPLITDIVNGFVSWATEGNKLGIIMEKVGEVIKTAWNTGVIQAIGAAVLAIKAASVAFTVFNAILAANPIVLIAAGIVAAIGGIVAAIILIHKNWNRVQSFMAITIEKLKAAFIIFGSKISEAMVVGFNNAKIAMYSLANAIYQKLFKAFLGLIDIIDKLDFGGVFTKQLDAARNSVNKWSTDLNQALVDEKEASAAAIKSAKEKQDATEAAAKASVKALEDEAAANEKAANAAKKSADAEIDTAGKKIQVVQLTEEQIKEQEALAEMYAKIAKESAIYAAKVKDGLMTEEESREALVSLYSEQIDALYQMGATSDGTDEKSEALRKYIVLMKQLGKTVSVIQPATEKGVRNLVLSFVDGAKNVAVQASFMMGQVGKVISAGFSVIGGIVSRSFSMLSAIAKFDPNNMLKSLGEFLGGLENFFLVDLALAPVWGKAAILMIKSFLDGMVKNLPKIIETIGNALNGLADLIIEYAPGMIEAAGKLIMGILQGIANAAPKLVKAALTIVMSLVNFVLKNLPMIIKLGMEILTALLLGIAAALPDILNAIADALPTIIDAVVEIIPLLIEALIAALPDIIEALILITPLLMAALFVLKIKLILALIEHLDDIVLAIIGALPLVVKAIIDAFATIFKTYIALALDLYDTGMQIIQGLINGITDGANKLLAGIGQLFYDWIVTPVKNMFGIHSPSTVFAGIGGDMIQGLINGIKSVGSGAWNAVSSVFSGLWDNVKSVFSGALDFGKGIVSSLSSGLSGAASAAQKAVGTVASGAQAVASGAANIAQTAISAVVSGAKAAGSLASTAASTVSSVASSAGSAVVSGIKKLKFWAKGTNSAPGGLSVVGEAGTELITTPGGQAALAMGGTLVNLPQGSSVLNARDTQAALSLSSLAGSFGSSRIGSSLPTINILATLKTYLDEREIGRAAFEQMDVLAGGAFGY